MKTVIEICSHQIEFDYNSKSPNAVPNESEIEHVKELLCNDYVCGELNMQKHINRRNYEFRGWWKILEKQ